MNSELCGISLSTSQELSIKFRKDISYRAWEILKLVTFHWWSMPTTRLTNIQKIQNYLDPVCQCLKNVFKTSEKISHPDQEIYLSHVGKKVSKLPAWQPYKKCRIIWIQCANVSRMSSNIPDRFLIQIRRYTFV